MNFDRKIKNLFTEYILLEVEIYVKTRKIEVVDKSRTGEFEF